ncbi:MAG: hypothetical protein P8Z75_13500 [Gammaproteobacteria bacterium]
MKKVKSYIYLVILSVISVPALARTVLPETTIPGTELGIQYSDYKYQETVNGAFFMSNKGNKIGLTWTSISDEIGKDWHAIWDLRYAFGDDTYNSASGTGTAPDRLWDLRIMAGKDHINQDQDFVLFTFGGLAYRTLTNDLRKVGPGGYRRVSEYFYVPLGITFRNRISSDTRISTSIEYDYFVKGSQLSQLSDINPALNDLKNNQTKGYGYRATITYEKPQWSVGLFYYYWNIGASDFGTVTLIDGTPIGIGQEPKNDTKELGIELKRRF